MNLPEVGTLLPVIGFIRHATNPLGLEYHSDLSMSFKCLTTSRMIGAAPVTPETPCIGVPSKFPTQTPTVNFGVYPNAQLSRKSELVPVLQATGKSNSSAECVPKEPVRAFESERISATHHAAFLSKIR